jgi:hypothetical protein
VNLRKVKVDPFATSKIAREFNLRAPQAWVLHLLAIQAGYRSGEWAGTLSSLADDSRLSPRTVAAAVRVLIDKGLVEERAPFRQGNEVGRVFVPVRDRIVLERRPVPDLASISPRFGPDSDEKVQNRENDQGEEGIREVLRQRGMEGVSEGSLCKHCHEPMQGHVYGEDHEAEAVTE